MPQVLPFAMLCPLAAASIKLLLVMLDVLHRDVVLVALPVSTVGLEHRGAVVNETLLLSVVLLMLGPLPLVEPAAEVAADVELPELVLVVVAVCVVVPVPVVTVQLEVTLQLV